MRWADQSNDAFFPASREVESQAASDNDLPENLQRIAFLTSQSSNIHDQTYRHMKGLQNVFVIIKSVITDISSLGY